MYSYADNKGYIYVYIYVMLFFFNREKVPRVPETLLKKRKSLEQLKAARAKAQLQQKKVGGIPTFLRQFRGGLYCMTLYCT